MSRHPTTRRDSPQAAFPDVDIGAAPSAPLAADYIESPFSILHTASGRWRTRKAEWKEILGVRLEGATRRADIHYQFRPRSPADLNVRPGAGRADSQSWFSPPAGTVYNPDGRGCGAGLRGVKPRPPLRGAGAHGSEQVEANAKAVPTRLSPVTTWGTPGGARTPSPTNPPTSFSPARHTGSWNAIPAIPVT